MTIKGLVLVFSVLILGVFAGIGMETVLSKDFAHVSDKYQTHPIIKQLSYNITYPCKHLQYMEPIDEWRNCSVKEIYKWTSENIPYQQDSYDEYAQNPLETLEIGTGDCEDLSILQATLFKSVGIDAKIICEKEIQHCWTEVI